VDEEEVPDCFTEFESDHPECGRCLVRTACREEWRRDRRAGLRTRTRRNRGTVRTTNKPRSETERTEVDRDVGFLQTLGYNGILEGVTAFFQELFRAATSIPRIGYPNPWGEDDDE